MAAGGKAAAATAIESLENSDPNEERRLSKELCLQDVVFPIDDDMSSGADDFLPQVGNPFSIPQLLFPAPERHCSHPLANLNPTLMLHLA